MNFIIKDSNELRSTIRFLLRIFWLLFLHSTFGPDYNSSLSSSLGGSLDDDEETDENINSNQQQHFAESSRTTNQQQQVSLTVLILEESTSSVWLAVYSCCFFVVTLFVTSIIFFAVSFISEKLFTNKNKTTDDNEDDDQNQNQNHQPSKFLSTPLPGYELFPFRHISHLIVNIATDLAVVPFVSPRFILLLWPCVELSICYLQTSLNQISQHMSSGKFSLKFLTRVIQSRTTMASCMLVGMAFVFCLFASIAEHGIARFSTAAWLMIHSFVFLTILRQYLVETIIDQDRFLFFFSWKNKNKNKNNSDDKNDPHQQSNTRENNMITPVVENSYAKYGGRSYIMSCFKLFKAAFEGLIMMLGLFIVARFFRLRGSNEDSLSFIVSFVCTELFSFSPSSSSLHLILLRCFFWITIVISIVLGCSSQRSAASSKISNLIWTILSSMAEPFDHSLRTSASSTLDGSQLKTALAQLKASKPSNQTTNTTNETFENDVDRNDQNEEDESMTATRNSATKTIPQEVLTHLHRQSTSSSSNRISLPRLFASLLIQIILLFIIFDLIFPYIISPSPFASFNVVNHDLLLFLWCVLGLPLFAALNHMLSSSSSSFSANSIPFSIHHHEFDEVVNPLDEKEEDHAAINLHLHEQLIQEYYHALTSMKNKYRNNTNNYDNDNDDENRNESLKSIFNDIWNTPHERRLFIFFCFTASFMFVEFIVGTKSNSLGLISDAFHMLIDSSSILIGLVTCYAAKWKPTKKHPFGFKKYEALSGMLNGLLLIVVSFHIMHEAYHRVERYRGMMRSSNNKEDGSVVSSSGLSITNIHQVIPVSIAGLILNVIGVVFFHDQQNQQEDGEEDDNNTKNIGDECSEHHKKKCRHCHDGSSSSSSAHEANMRGVFLHILADLLGSLAVVTSSIIISYHPSWYVVDPLCASVVSVLILLASWSLLSSTFEALVEK